MEALAHRYNIYSTINVASTWRRGPAFCVARDAEQLLFIYCAGLRLESLHSPPTVTTHSPSPVLLPCPRALGPAGPGRGLLNSLTPRRRAETRDLHSPNNA